MRYLLISFILLACQAGRAQGDLNLDFERLGPDSNLLGGWYFGDSGGSSYTAELSTQNPAAGERCFTITSLENTDSTFAAISTRLPASLVAGKVIRLKGMVRTAPDSEYVAAGFYANASDMHKKTIAFTQTYDQYLGEPGVWTPMELELSIPPEAVSVNLGGVFRGQGELSFDALQLYFDDAPYVAPHEIEKDLTISPTRPDDPRLEWLRQYIHPLRSTEADFPTTTDLTAFGAAVGESAVVGLGESTHGSHEIFTLKDRLFRYLHQHHDFRTFVLEAPLIQSYDVNDYIESGEGSVPKLLTNIGFWPWQTEEVVELIKGMRHAPGKTRPRFTGMDMQNYTQAYRILKDRFGDNADLQADLVELRNKLDLVRYDRHEGSGYVVPERYLRVVNRVIPKLNAAITEANLSERDTKWLRHMVRLIEQFVDEEGTQRDGYMAENVQWIRSVEHNDKAVLWAHNEHVIKLNGRMGDHLAALLESDYVAVAFTFADGQYTHSHNGVKKAVGAETPYPATYEYWFDRLDEPMFYLDLREMEHDTTPYADWFRHGLQFRKVGTRKLWSEFGDENLTEAYDIIFFVGSSSPSRMLPVSVLYGYEEER